MFTSFCLNTTTQRTSTVSKIMSKIDATAFTGIICNISVISRVTLAAALALASATLAGFLCCELEGFMSNFLGQVLRLDYEYDGPKSEFPQVSHPTATVVLPRLPLAAI